MGGCCSISLPVTCSTDLGRESGYPLLFAIGSTFHLLGFLWILLTIRDVRPIAFQEETSSPTPVSASTFGGGIDGGAPDNNDFGSRPPE